MNNEKRIVKKQNGKPARPNCYGCIHFYITHEPSHPYGCNAMGFKSVQNPAVTVFSSSGIRCQMFIPKKDRQKT